MISLVLIIGRDSWVVEELLRLNAPFVTQVFAVVLGFVISIRVTTAWNRYWEGATKLLSLSCRWLDSAMQIFSFIHASVRVAQRSCFPAFRARTWPPVVVPSGVAEPVPSHHVARPSPRQGGRAPVRRASKQ